MKRERRTDVNPVAIIASLTRQLAGKDAQIEVLVNEVKSLEQTVSRLSDEVATLSRALYGTSSERSAVIGAKTDSDSQEAEQSDDGDMDGGADEPPHGEIASGDVCEAGECPGDDGPRKPQRKYHHPSKRDYSTVKSSRTIHVYPSEEEMAGARFVKTVFSRRLYMCLPMWRS